MCMFMDFNLIEFSVVFFYVILKYLLFVEFLKIDILNFILIFGKKVGYIFKIVLFIICGLLLM